jgi:hypothetical protein
MPLVTYTASKFGKHWGSSLSGRHTLPISWSELVWAAMTMGKPGIAYLLAHGWHSLSDLIVRAHTVYANLRETPGFLEKSSLYADLDPSEKSGVSYFMGMLAAKVLGQRLLDVPWLFHVSMIRAIGGAVALRGRSQPDLVGLRKNGNWVVAEAKGRTLGYSSSAMATAKSQTRQLRRVNGAYPSLRVAVQSYFTPRMQWDLEDPAEYDDHASDMEFDLGRAFDSYYSGAIASTQQGAELRPIGDRAFVARTIDEIGVTVAIERETRERIISRTLLERTRVPRVEVQETLQPDGGFVVFPDGLAIALDERWSVDRMQRDPGARRSS